MIQNLHDTLRLAWGLLDQRRHELRIDGGQARLIRITASAAHGSPPSASMSRLTHWPCRVGRRSLLQIDPTRLFQPLIFSQIHLTDQIRRRVRRLAFLAGDIPIRREHELMLGFLRLQRLNTLVQRAARLLQELDALFRFFLKQIDVRLSRIDLRAFHAESDRGPHHYESNDSPPR